MDDTDIAQTFYTFHLRIRSVKQTDKRIPLRFIGLGKHDNISFPNYLTFAERVSLDE